MIKLIKNGVLIKNGEIIEDVSESGKEFFRGTIAYGILSAHNVGNAGSRREKSGNPGLNGGGLCGEKSGNSAICGGDLCGEKSGNPGLNGGGLCGEKSGNSGLNGGGSFNEKSGDLCGKTGKNVDFCVENTFFVEKNDCARLEKDSSLRLKFDALASHDITYVGIIQTAKASGLKSFPVPYVLTNCHNSLCAVGGTINEDDHVFGLSAAKKYGGIFVPAHLAVIHTYMRENAAKCGGMILGSDSHTRYGALGTLAVGEGGPELVKQLLGKTYDIKYPEVVAVVLNGKPKKGVGSQDVALAIIRAVYDGKFVNNKIMEFVGGGIAELDIEYRNGIDVMTTETTCLSSVWATDGRVAEYFKTHGREGDYKELKPAETAYYDGAVIVDLDKIEPMIALPFHPKNAYTVRELKENLEDILAFTEREGNKLLGKNAPEFMLRDKITGGKLKVSQGIIAGCAGGTYDNIFTAANILDKKSTGCGGFSLSVYPSSQPVYLDLLKKGALEKLIRAGSVVKTAFCGPCFGAGDVPCNNALSIRHTTRNFESREGSKPSDGQISSVALMDARSIAATAANGGFLTAATEIEYDDGIEKFVFDDAVYKNRVYNGYKKADANAVLTYGPNIADWPKIYPLPETLILKAAAVINDPVTTTDELIPSGETSSYRSNPKRLAEFTLSRKDPGYVARAKEIAADAEKIVNGEIPNEYAEALRLAGVYFGIKGGESAETVPENGVKSAESAANGSGNCGIAKGRESAENGVKAVESVPEKGVKSAESAETGPEKGVKNIGKSADGIAAIALGSVVFAKKPGDGSAREQAASCQRVLGGAANIANSYATKRYRSNLINWGMPPFLSDEEYAVGDILIVKNIRKLIAEGAAEFPCVRVKDGECGEIILKIDPLTADEREIILKGCLMNYYAG
ncbi:MAG: hydratase [Clostridiales bacterium]|jgi:aconitate hydratase|nr:hydratase [Clostridiales bacterium]